MRNYIAILHNKHHTTQKDVIDKTQFKGSDQVSINFPKINGSLNILL